MQMARRRDLVASLAFAGVLIWGAAVAHPAAAGELAGPAASALRLAGCAIVQPRFEPLQPRVARAPRTISFQGGAKLRSLVGEPCPQISQPREV